MKKVSVFANRNFRLAASAHGLATVKNPNATTSLRIPLVPECCPIQMSIKCCPHLLPKDASVGPASAPGPIPSDPSHSPQSSISFKAAHPTFEHSEFPILHSPSPEVLVKTTPVVHNHLQLSRHFNREASIGIPFLNATFFPSVPAVPLPQISAPMPIPSFPPSPQAESRCYPTQALPM